MKRQHLIGLLGVSLGLLMLFGLSFGIHAKADTARLSTGTSAEIGTSFVLKLKVIQGSEAASDLKLVVTKRNGDEEIRPVNGAFPIVLNPEEFTIDLKPRLMDGDTLLDRRETEYSGALYVKALASSGLAGDGMKTMLADLLEYAAAAQGYYNYRNEDLANADRFRWDGYQPSAFTPPEPAAASVTTAGDGVRIRSANLYLEADTVSVQFRGTAPQDALITVNGSTEGFTVTRNDTDFVVRMAPIAMSALSESSYALSVAAGENTASVTYGVANYIANKTNAAYEASGNAYMMELAKRLWNYGQSAKNYYDNLPDIVLMEATDDDEQWGPLL